jgi:uncharacterized protein YndB with AHSA1/START domain
VRELTVTVELAVGASELWRAITAHEDLPSHTSFLREVRVVGERREGVGLVRRCTLAQGASFTERVTAWEPGHRYCYAPDLSGAPFPFAKAEACWSLDPTPSGTRLSYRLSYEPRNVLDPRLWTLPMRMALAPRIREMLLSYAST